MVKFDDDAADFETVGLPSGEPGDFSALARYITDVAVDGYLLDAGGDESDQRYLTGFDAPDPFIACYDGAEVALLVSGLEYGRAVSEARAGVVRRFSEFDFRDLLSEYGRHEARVRAIAAFLDDRDVDAVAVPSEFPLGTADGLREQGIAITLDEDGVIEEIRSTKTATEAAEIQAVQRANERAMEAAESVLDRAEVVDPGRAREEHDLESLEGDAPVLIDDGAVLTSERVKTVIETALLEVGCALDETIVACGSDGAEPHNRGTGPLRAGEPIVIDIFPRSKTTGYHADMTRTFVVGTPSDAARDFYDVTMEAHAAGLATIEAGVSGEAVDDAVSEVYEDAGCPTIRRDEETETGFIHGTGHGVGLDVHEPPRLSRGGDTLEVGHVVTVEPGLYDPAVGGVRIEDLVVVTEDGYRNLTTYPKTFVL